MLSKHELEDMDGVSLTLSLEIPSLIMVVCSFVSFCVDIPHVQGDL